MKYILMIAVFLTSISAHAGWIDSIATSDWPTKKEVKKYKLDMYGFDGRVYEFKTDNGLTCVVLYSGGEQKGAMMQCISTKEAGGK